MSMGAGRRVHAGCWLRADAVVYACSSSSSTSDPACIASCDVCLRLRFPGFPILVYFKVRKDPAESLTAYKGCAVAPLQECDAFFLC